MSEYWDERWRKGQQPTLAVDVADAVDRSIFDLISTGENYCKSVLDFGAGIGRWRDFFVERQFAYYAHDASEEAARVGQNRGIEYGQRKCDLVFTNTVLIHADDSAFAEVLSLAAKKIICVETCWPHPPVTQCDHMRYRALHEFISLFGDRVTVERIERVGVHHLFVFSIAD